MKPAPHAHEVNLDGLVGPTHHYGGLSYGNVASMEYAENVSNPRAAALEGLAKMRLLAHLGVKQIVLPPQPRPSMDTLRALGFGGSDAEILKRADRDSPALLAACSSASSMWAANSATVSPSADSEDGRVHITPANLVHNLHRAIEPPFTSRVLKAIFPDERLFVHHSPLPATATLSDEGSANHTRLAPHHRMPGLELFAYGRKAFDRTASSPARFPPRQTLEACQIIARIHRLNLDRVIFAQQHPDAIDAGVFHNDVISVGNENLFFYHERAFVNTSAVVDQMRHMAEKLGLELHLLKVPDQQLPLHEAVRSYLFNSQIVTLPSGKMALLAPAECEAIAATKALLDNILAMDNPISEVHYVNLKQSMCNGGGPACLRLRLVLTEEELEATNASVFLTDQLYEELVTWIETFYRDRLTLKDLGDPLLLEESTRALDALSRILRLPTLR